MFEELEKDLPERISLRPSRKDFSRPAAYALLHPSSGKAYVGSTRDLYKRLNQHRTRLLAGQHKNKGLQEAFDKDPRFDLRYVPAKDKIAALTIEQELLDKLHPTGNLFNIGLDATNHQRGRPVSDDVKRILKKKTEEQFSTCEARKKHSEISKEKWKDQNYRENRSVRTLTDDLKRTLSEAGKSAWSNPESREKILHHRQSEEFRDLIRKMKSKPVVIDGITFPSAVAAGKAHGKSDTWARKIAKKQLDPRHGETK